MQFFMRLIILIICMGALSPVHAIDSAFKRFESVCDLTASDCLVELQRVLETLEPFSPKWYDTKLTMLELLFQLHQYEALYRYATDIVTEPDLPKSFLTQVEIYLAKCLYHMGKTAEASNILNHAISQLQGLNNQLPDPTRLIDIANLLHVNGEPQRAFRILVRIESQLGKRYAPVFNRELYANLAQAVTQLQDRELAVDYYTQALYWAKLAGDKQQVAVIQANIGMMHLHLQAYRSAADAFYIAVEIANDAQDLPNRAIYQLRLVESLLALPEYEQAKAQFALITAEHLPTFRRDLYHKLKQQIVSHTR
jgi:tetratricopeptide (TPR) repeat protein